MDQNRKTKFPVERICLDALFAALYVVLGSFLTAKLTVIEFSIATVPIVLCAFLLGPLDAFLVALVGSFLEQLLYGLDATAVIWMLPVILHALYVGLFGLLLRKRDGKIKRSVSSVLVIVTGEILLTLLNTAGLAYAGYLALNFRDFGALMALMAPRFLNCGVRAVICCALVLLLLPILQKQIEKRRV